MFWVGGFGKVHLLEFPQLRVVSISLSNEMLQVIQTSGPTLLLRSRFHLLVLALLQRRSSWIMCVFPDLIGLLKNHFESFSADTQQITFKSRSSSGYRRELRSVEHKEISQERSVLRVRRGWQRERFEWESRSPCASPRWKRCSLLL